MLSLIALSVSLVQTKTPSRILVAAIDLNRLGGSGEPPLPMESIESIRKQKRPAVAGRFEFN
jgi:hypothetical protein